jgi:3-phenylpropionate/trans-cinnamate dioxygenase ferredoxin reductase subunit
VREIVIVGAGHGGTQAAAFLRQHRFVGSITLISDEVDLPYERPPLSKEYLAGEKSVERMLLHPASFWGDRDIELLVGRSVNAVDVRTKQLSLQDGGRINYRQLIWATGGNPRRLRCEGADAAGVHTIRTRADVDSLKSELENANHIVVVGGGFIGLEAAAVLTRLGKKVTLLEALDRVLARVAAEPLSRFYEAEHSSRGVDLRLGVQVTTLECRGWKPHRLRSGYRRYRH